MVIENRGAVVAGTKLVATYKKAAYVCIVEAGTDGKLAFVYDGKSYNSPSSAGAAVIGGACNGWRLWSIDGETPAPRPAGKVTAASKARAKTAAKPTARKARAQESAPRVLHRHDDQSELSEGETRWVCNACLKNFIVFGNEVPGACPEGHRNDDPELASAPGSDVAAVDKAEATAE